MELPKRLEVVQQIFCTRVLHRFKLLPRCVINRYSDDDDYAFTSIRYHPPEPRETTTDRHHIRVNQVLMRLLMI